ncbi:hypothetical protein R1flu_000680 [Riccia fluitans]|uniref:Uncharacterized protein n=1 Tax=Riccia fluitans TaxID=41844 RepID=A0ABD1Y146_9MARC
MWYTRNARGNHTETSDKPNVRARSNVDGTNPMTAELRRTGMAIRPTRGQMIRVKHDPGSHAEMLGSISAYGIRRNTEC